MQVWIFSVNPTITYNNYDVIHELCQLCITGLYLYFNYFILHPNYNNTQSYNILIKSSQDCFLQDETSTSFDLTKTILIMHLNAKLIYVDTFRHLQYI